MQRNPISLPRWGDVVPIILEKGSDGLMTAKQRPCPAESYIKSLKTEQSRAKVRRIATQIASMVSSRSYTTCDWARMNRNDIEAIRTHLIETQTAATVNLYLSVFRGIAKCARDESVIRDPICEDILAIPLLAVRPRAKTKVLRKKRTQSVPANLSTCSAKLVRDAAIIALHEQCGLRRSQISALRIDQVNEDNQTLTILGPKESETRMKCPSDAWAKLDDWLAIRGSSGVPHVFCHVTKAGRASKGTIDVFSHVRDNGIYAVLKSR